EHKKKLQRMVTFGSIGAAVLVIGGLGLYFGKIKPENDAREASTRNALIQQAEESKRLQAQLAEQNQKVSDLLAQLSTAKDEKTRAELKAKLADAQKAQAGLAKQATGGAAKSGGGDAPPKAKPCNCQPGDPLCSCL